MAKVLISFLGVAAREQRRYSTASYQFPGSDETHTSSFIAKAIQNHLQIDKFILIGTAHSMWENVYESFGPNENEDEYLNIWEECSTANHDSEPDLSHLTEVEGALGNGSKAVVIKYGLNDEELQFNMVKILEIEQHLNNGDEIYVDITHSFRSIPIYVMNVLMYLQMVSSKKLEIKGVFYGMLDVKSEFNDNAKVVNLNNLLDVNRWITAANSFFETGNAYLIADLLENTEDNGKAPILRNFSDALQLNNLNAIRNMLTNIGALRNADSYANPLAKKILPGVLSKLYHQLNGATQSQFQFHIAQWHKNHNRYGLAYADAVEAMITLFVERYENFLSEGNEWFNFSEFKKRENIKTLIKEDFPRLLNVLFPGDNRKALRNEVKEIYRNINSRRNALIHQDSQYEANSRNLIDTLKLNMDRMANLPYFNPNAH